MMHKNSERVGCMVQMVSQDLKEAEQAVSTAEDSMATLSQEVAACAHGCSWCQHSRIQLVLNNVCLFRLSNSSESIRKPKLQWKHKLPIWSAGLRKCIVLC